jgi:hypothetical protein
VKPSFGYYYNVSDAFSESPTQQPPDADGREYSGLRLYSAEFPDVLYVEYTDGGRAFFDCQHVRFDLLCGNILIQICRIDIVLIQLCQFLSIRGVPN